MKTKNVDIDRLTYFDPKKNWTKIKKHLDNPELNSILVRDFNKYTFGRWREPFLLGMYPREFESCFWWESHRGREPSFWRYVKHGACHWLVNFNLRLAELVMPGEAWRIRTGEHSTVWNGKECLFDLNFVALEVSPAECFDLSKGRELQVGKQLGLSLAEHYLEETRRNKELLESTPRTRAR